MSAALSELRRGTCLPLLLAVSVFGCSDPPVVTASPTPSKAADTSPAAAPAGSGAAAAASAAPAPARVEVQETEFSESDRSRDPFRSFAKSFTQETKPESRDQREVILSEYALDELKLIGIVTRAEPAKAMLVDPNGKGFVVRRGQFVGRADVVQAAGASGTVYKINWRVDRIRPGDVVLIREDPTNPDVPSATRVIPLRPDEESNVGGEKTR